MRRLLPLILLFLALPLPLAAQENPWPILRNEENCNITTGRVHFECFPIYLARTVQVLFSLIGMFALIQIMIAGYQWAVGSLGVTSITSVDSAKKRLWGAIAGLLFSLLVFAVMNFVISSITSGT